VIQSSSAKAIALAAEERMLGRVNSSMSIASVSDFNAAKEFLELVEGKMDAHENDKAPTQAQQEAYDLAITAMKKVFPKIPHTERLVRLGIVAEVLRQLKTGDPIVEMFSSLALVKEFFNAVFDTVLPIEFRQAP
jgi:hypothetical protein